MTTEEIRSILYDLHSKNAAQIECLHRDMQELKVAFTAHESASRVVAAVFGAIGSIVFTVALAILNWYK